MNIKNYAIKYRIPLILISIFSVFTLCVMLTKKTDTSTPVVVGAIEKSDDSLTESDSSFLNVDIKGAIKNPGVYRMEKGSLVQDVIDMAGGLTKDATTININLSKKVCDEMVIYIYTKSEYKKINSSNSEKSTQLKGEETKKEETIINNTCNSKSNDSLGENSSNNISTDNDSNSLININTASKEELLSLTGIGESKADCIITYRQENGQFNSIEEIKNVSGIGDALFEKIKNQITI